MHAVYCVCLLAWLSSWRVLLHYICLETLSCNKVPNTCQSVVIKNPSERGDVCDSSENRWDFSFVHFEVINWQLIFCYLKSQPHLWPGPIVELVWKNWTLIKGFPVRTLFMIIGDILTEDVIFKKNTYLTSYAI